MGSTNVGWFGCDDVVVFADTAQLVHQRPMHQQVQRLGVQQQVVKVDGQLVVLHTSPLSFETFHLFY